jgi:hypothetical protein
MTEGDIEHAQLQDALSSVTRKERQFLLGISLLGIALVKTGLIPSKISGLGIEFQSANPQALLSIVACVILYFLVAFIIYAASDYVVWKLSISSQVHEKELDEYNDELHGYYGPQTGSPEEALEEYRHKLRKKILRYFKMIKPISIFRAFFDLGLPIIIGGYALFILIRAVV